MIWWILEFGGSSKHEIFGDLFSSHDLVMEMIVG
jgi:hypothetical protein